jgi:hypothetical protein
MSAPAAVAIFAVAGSLLGAAFVLAAAYMGQKSATALTEFDAVVVEMPSARNSTT